MPVRDAFPARLQAVKSCVMRSFHLFSVQLFAAFSLLFSPASGIAQANDTLSLKFESGSAGLSPDARNLLDSLVRARAVWPARGVLVLGWADSSGNPAANLTLSARRAEAVTSYLRTKGIPDSALAMSKGNGIGYRFGEKREQRQVQVIIPAVRSLRGRLKPDLKLYRGRRVEIVGLLFQGGSATLLPVSLPVLDVLHQIMINNPEARIRIVGHICCGSAIGVYPIDSMTQWLSTERARTVYDYLRKQGIDSTRLRYEGRGFTQPRIYPELNELDRSTNRRVEIEVL